MTKELNTQINIVKKWFEENLDSKVVNELKNDFDNETEKTERNSLFWFACYEHTIFYKEYGEGKTIEKWLYNLYKKANGNKFYKVWDKISNKYYQIEE